MAGQGLPVRAADVVVLLVGVGLLTAGCTTSAAPVQPPDRSSPPASTLTATVAAPTSGVPSLSAPGRLPGEIARTVISRQVNSITSGDFPKATDRFYLHLRCTGPDGSVLRYQILHGDGTPFGPSGDWNCDRTPGVIGDQSNRAYTGAVQIQLQADPGVTTAWAVLSTTAEGE